MAQSEIEREIEHIRYSIEQLEQHDILYNCDVKEELYQCYGQLIALSLQLPSYFPLYLETLLNKAQLYLEEGAYEKAESLLLQMKADATQAGEDFQKYQLDAYVNLPAVYDRQNRPDDFARAVDEAKQALDCFLKDREEENPDILYIYGKRKLHLAGILYTNCVYEQALTLSQDAFIFLSKATSLNKRTVLQYADSAAVWLPFYKQQKQQQAIAFLCQGLLDFSTDLRDERYYFTVICILNKIATEYVEENEYKQAKEIFCYLQEIYSNNETILPTVLHTSSVGKNRKLNGKEIIKRANKSYEKLQKEDSTSNSKKTCW